MEPYPTTVLDQYGNKMEVLDIDFRDYLDDDDAEGTLTGIWTFYIVETKQED